MEFVILKFAFAIVLSALFGFGVGRKWETLNSPEDIVAFYKDAKAKVEAEIAGLETKANEAKAKLEQLKNL
jgi:hypothetical protein